MHEPVPLNEFSADLGPIVWRTKISSKLNPRIWDLRERWRRATYSCSTGICNSPEYPDCSRYSGIRVAMSYCDGWNLTGQAGRGWSYYWLLLGITWREESQQQATIGHRMRRVPSQTPWRRHWSGPALAPGAAQPDAIWSGEAEELDSDHTKCGGFLELGIRTIDLSICESRVACW
jgi:hypothetical protein